MAVEKIELITPQQTRRRVKTPVGGKSMAKQAFKQECDINNIVNQFRKNRTVSHLNNAQPRYGFAPAVELREALEMVAHATENFEHLPGDIRREFDNDPIKFVEFVENPENGKALVKMGLADPRPAEQSGEAATGAEGAAEPAPTDGGAE